MPCQIDEQEARTLSKACFFGMIKNDFKTKKMGEARPYGIGTGRLAVLKDYVALTKPGIIRLNAIAAFGGFWVASKWDIDWLLLIYMLVGSALTMASACVINNYWDRELDKKMERTKNRALPTNRMNPTNVLIYGIVLGVAGITILFTLVNVRTGWLGLLGMFVYIVIYTMWLKRTSTWSTSIGGISGAMPPVIGYCAVQPSGCWRLDFVCSLISMAASAFLVACDTPGRRVPGCRISAASGCKRDYAYEAADGSVYSAAYSDRDFYVY